MGTYIRPRFLIIFSFFVLSFVAFYNSLQNPFVLDDIHKIVDNPDTHSLDSMFSKLVYPYHDPSLPERNDPSRPLVYFLYTIAYHIGGGKPWPFHVLNTGLHWLCGSLVFLLSEFIFKKLWKRISLLGPITAAVLFLILPIQAGTVVYIYGLSDLLSSVFLLSSLYCFALYLKHSQRRYLPGTWICFTLALLSKQSAVILPGLFILLDWSILNHWKWNRLKNRVTIHSGFIFLSVVYLGLRWFYLGGVGDLEGAEFFRTITTVEDYSFQYLFIQGVMFFKYVFLTWIPVGLSLDHFIHFVDYSEEIQGIAWASILGILLWIVLLQKQESSRNLLLGFSALFYGICLVPTNSFVPAVDLFVERRAYLPNFAWVLLLGGVVNFVIENNWLIRRTKFLLLLLSSSIFVIYFTQTLNRNKSFSLSEQPFLESLKLYPQNIRAMKNLGIILLKKNNLDGAKKYFERVLDLDHQNAEAVCNLGFIYATPEFRDFNLPLGLHYFLWAAKLSPSDFISRFNAAIISCKMEKTAEAEALFLNVIQINPVYAPAYQELGKLYERENRFGEAKKWFEKAKEIRYDRTSF